MKIAILPGDGIGTEIVEQAVRVLNVLDLKFETETALVGGAAWVIVYLGLLDWRPAILVALALMTPSTGFILDSLHSLAKDENDRFWIRSKAVAT